MPKDTRSRVERMQDELGERELIAHGEEAWEDARENLKRLAELALSMGISREEISSAGILRDEIDETVRGSKGGEIKGF